MLLVRSPETRSLHDCQSNLSTKQTARVSALLTGPQWLPPFFRTEAKSLSVASRPLRTWSTLSCSALRCFSNSGFIIEPHRTAYALSDSTGIHIVPFAQTSPLSSLLDWPAPSCFFSSFSSDSISLGKPSRPVPNRCLSLCFHCTWHLSLLLLLSQDPGCLFIHSLIGSTHIYRAGSGDRMVS